MKKNYALSQQFAIIGLDGQSALQRSAAKAAVVRGIAVASLLEQILLEGEAVVESCSAKLEAGLKEIGAMKRKEAACLEQETAKQLMTAGVLELIPDLLGCDMDYVTAGLELKAYRSDADLYLAIAEGLRGEILEEGAVTVECICLLWLLRESGCMHEIFSVREQEQIQERLVKLAASGDGEQAAAVAAVIWKQEFHKVGEQVIKSFLQGKRKLFQNPYLEGINLLFPFLDRRQSIFIDFVVLGTDVKQRRRAVAMYLSEKGHYVEEVKHATETLLRIDNMYYRIWPKTVVVNRIPIQGASLLPVYR